MPTRDGSYFSVINKLKSRTLYLGHLADQRSLNEGNVRRLNSNGKTASVVSEYAAGSSGFIGAPAPSCGPPLPAPTRPINLTSSSVTQTSFIINWDGGSGATSYTYSLNGAAAIPSFSTAQSATFSNLIYNTLYSVIVTAINAGGNTSSYTFYVTTERIYLTGYGNMDVLTVKYSTDGIAKWAQIIGGPGDDEPLNILSDSAGNVYVSGYYTSSSWTISPTISLLNPNNSAIFIVKYSDGGTPLWAQSIAATSQSAQKVKMLLDSAGNVYMAGQYELPLTISPTVSLTNSGGTDIFVVKYSTNGIAQWAKSIGGSGDDRLITMLLDSAGNVYVSGYYTSALIISPTVTLTNSGSFDTFIVKYSTNGIVQWANKIGGTGLDTPVNMLLDSAGNVYVTGYYSSAPNSGGLDIFIVKYSSDGTALWAKSIGGTGNDRPLKMLLDSAGNVYIVGYYNSSTLTISPSISLTNSTTSAFIVKYSIDGTAQWGKSFELSAQLTLPINMLLDSAGNVYVGGYYDSASLIISPTVRLTNSVGINTFIVKYATDGTPQWVQGIAAATENEKPVNILLDSIGNVYLCGYYESALTISNISLTNSGNSATFIVKYATDGTALWAKNIDGNGFNRPVNMLLDSTGNLYVSGFYNSSALAISSSISLPTSGTNDTFIVKYATDGRALWAKRSGGVSEEFAVNMILDSAGNLYLSAYTYSANIQNV